MWSLQTLVFLSAIISVILLRRLQNSQRKNPKRLPFPPGPKPLPLIGNARDIPYAYQWFIYADWSKRLRSDMIHMEALGQHVFVLNSFQASSDLLDKRSNFYSDRPRQPMIIDLMGWTWALSLMPYGSEWRKQRRMSHEYLNLTAAKQYKPIQLLEARKLLRRLTETPDDFMIHIRHTFGATIMKIVYGIDVSDSGDRYLANAEAVLSSLAQAGVPGSFLVDTFPALKYVPEWFPGANFKKKAREWRELLPEFIDRPFDAVRMAVAAGTATKSIVSNILSRIRDLDNYNSEDERGRQVAAILFAGGADTTVSTIQTFFLAMALHPEVQRLAQSRIGEVVGTDRLPSLSDIDFLPYITAIRKELLRWQLVVPLGVAHTVTVNDEYRGYHIPQGSIILPNQWAILHDENTYEDPLAFRPERFLREDGTLNTDILQPESVAFGFGRRICPGRFMAINGADIIIASVLSAFEIRPAVDEYGLEIPIAAEMTSGLLSYPVPFKCTIKPRKANLASLLSTAMNGGDTELALD